MRLGEGLEELVVFGGAGGVDVDDAELFFFI